jgi:hypothetical protein
MRPKWDTPLNRALNQLKGFPLDQWTEYGRVHGVGDGATWKYYYDEGLEAKKHKKKSSQLNIDEKVKLAVEKNATKAQKKAAKAAEATKNELVQQAGNSAVGACRNDFATNLIPAIIDWTKQNPDKTVQDFPMPSFVGSNSVNIAPPPTPATNCFSHSLLHREQLNEHRTHTRT